MSTQSALRVLVADDDPVTCQLLQTNLERFGFSVVVAHDGEEAFRILCEPEAPKLCILDWMMPGLDGVQVCERIRALNREPYTYFILLTVRDNKSDLVYALSVGADDYLSKPFDMDELEARIQAGKRILDLQKQLIDTRSALAHQVVRDSLTGLFSRTAILETLASELSRQSRSGVPFGLAMADLDHFKRVNDSSGHLVGDAVLRAVAQRMQASLRPYDSIGRFGGEEFLIILPGCRLKETLAVADRVRQSVGLKPILVEGASLEVTISLGVSSTEDQVIQTPEVLIAAADRALYRAKSAGRDRVEFEPIPES